MNLIGESIISQHIYILIRIYSKLGYESPSECALENEMHKFLLDFEIQMDTQIWARRRDLMTVDKKKK